MDPVPIETDASPEADTAIGVPTTKTPCASQFDVNGSHRLSKYDAKSYPRTCHTGPDADIDYRFGLVLPKRRTLMQIMYPFS